jgi:ribonuclease HII
MTSDYESAEIIDDSSSDEEYIIQPKVASLNPKVAPLNPKVASLNPKVAPLKKPKKPKVIKEKLKVVLKSYHNEDEKVFEIGVDEAGRGPLFGRVYTAAVILPKDDTFDYSKVKDSKKFHSKKKIEEAAEYIKNNALAWHVSYEDEKKIDEINILQATQSAMHNSIIEVRKKYGKILKSSGKQEKSDYQFSLLIDGNYFNPITTFNEEKNIIETIPYITVEGGDNKYASIAAASILAKVERDKYIDELCEEYPELSQHYGIDTNKGYGAKRHLEGIKEHGITVWHRRSFAPCKNYV